MARLLVFVEGRATSENIGLSEVSGGLSLESQVAEAKRLIRHSRAVNTRRGYRADVNDFFSFWARVGGPSGGVDALLNAPPDADVVLGWLGWLAQAQEQKPSTLRRKMAGLRAWLDERYGHAHGARDERIPRVIEGLARLGRYMPEVAAPLRASALARIARAKPRSPALVRNKALLLVGYAGAFRRSELVGMSLQHLQFEPAGVAVFVPFSKSDQAGRGRWKLIARNGYDSKGSCAVRWLERWMRLAEIWDSASGPVWRPVSRTGTVLARRLCDRWVNAVVADYMLGHGEGPWTAHSLRAGRATDLVTAGVDELAIRRLLHHESTAMTARYDRAGREGTWL